MRFILVTLLSINAVVVWSTATAIQFTADAVMSTPGRADVTTHLYYSSGRIRKEFMYYGEPVIQILDAIRHRSLMCFTQQMLCYENQSLEQISIGIENAITSPCDNDPGLQCENLGSETLNQRQAVKWKISTKPVNKNEKPEVAYWWLDAELNIPVKQILFNNTVIELIWQGQEQLNGRKTDKWVQTIRYQNGETMESMQWYDKELKISIKEAFANGDTQELQHIVVEKLPDTLFTIPQGYSKKVTEPQQNAVANNKSKTPNNKK